MWCIVGECDTMHPGVSICGVKTALCGEYEQLVHCGAKFEQADRVPGYCP